MMKGEAVVQITCCKEDKVINRDDTVVVEEPLEIYLDGVPYYFTMRFPGQEKELAVGQCYSEGIINSLEDINLVKYCGEESGNRVDIILNPKRKAAEGLIIKERRLPAYSGCGICGKEMVSDICTKIPYRKNTLALPMYHVNEILRTLEKYQDTFGKTGGIHAAGIFNKDFELLAFSEDIGRHNALDKALGRLILEEKLNDVMVVGLTSRLSYEMVQKAGRTNAEVLIGMSSPTSLGINLAKKINLTVVGFARQSRFNIYSGSERISTIK